MPKVPDIEAMLRAEAELVRRMRHNRFGYHGLADFVLKNGAYMPTPEGKLPTGIRRGKVGYCFENAGRLAAFNDRYIYCEGFALCVFPMLHAWIVDSETGQVLDPTWQGRRGLTTVTYYGIAVNTPWLLSQVYANEHWGLIDLPHERWPMLRESPDKWRHPITDKFTKIIVDSTAKSVTVNPTKKHQKKLRYERKRATS